MLPVENFIEGVFWPGKRGGERPSKTGARDPEKMMAARWTGVVVGAWFIAVGATAARGEVNERAVNLDLNQLGCPRDLPEGQYCLFHLTGLKPEQVEAGAFSPHPKFFNTGNRYSGGLYVAQTPVVALTECAAHVGIEETLKMTMIRVILNGPNIFDLREYPELSKERNSLVQAAVQRWKGEHEEALAHEKLKKAKLATQKDWKPLSIDPDVKYKETKQFKQEALEKKKDTIRYTSTQSLSTRDGQSAYGSKDDSWAAWNIFGSCDDETIRYCKEHGGPGWLVPWGDEAKNAALNMCTPEPAEIAIEMCEKCKACVDSITRLLPQSGVMSVNKYLSTKEGVCEGLVNPYGESVAPSEGMGGASTKAVRLCHEYRTANWVEEKDAVSQAVENSRISGATAQFGTENLRRQRRKFKPPIEPPPLPKPKNKI